MILEDDVEYKKKDPHIRNVLVAVSVRSASDKSWWWHNRTTTPISTKRKKKKKSFRFFTQRQTRNVLCHLKYQHNSLSSFHHWCIILHWSESFISLFLMIFRCGAGGPRKRFCLKLLYSCWWNVNRRGRCLDLWFDYGFGRMLTMLSKLPWWHWVNKLWFSKDNRKG